MMGHIQRGYVSVISYAKFMAYFNFDSGKKMSVESKKMIFRAFDRGVTHFYLANNYGPPYGAAETNFGKLLKSDLSSYRDELIISTKAGYDMWPGPYGEWGSKKYLIASLNQSLKRLNLQLKLWLELLNLLKI